MLKMTRCSITVIASLLLVFSYGSMHVVAQDAYEKAVLQVTTDSEEAEAHFWKGVFDADNVFFSRAASHFEQAIALDESFAMARFMHARWVPGLNQAQRQEKMTEVLASLTTASTGELLVATAIREQFDGNTSEARALYEAASNMMPDDPRIAVGAALTTGAGGSPERTAALQQVTETFPDYAAAHNTLAYQLWFTGDEAGAREAVKEYMKLVPEHPNSHDSYAELFQFSGMFSEAVAHYSIAVKLDENYFQGYFGLAEAHALAGETDKAREYLMRAKPFAPTAAGRNNLIRAEANIYFLEGNIEKGIEVLKTAARQFEADENSGLAAQAHRELAVAEAISGNRDYVQAHLDKALEFQDVNAAQHSWSAVAYGLSGNADAAEKSASAFEEAVSGGANNFVHTLKGLALLVAGNPQKAEDELIRSGLQDPWSNAFMAWCQKEMDHEAEAEGFERNIMADNQFTALNVGFSLARLSLTNVNKKFAQ